MRAGEAWQSMTRLPITDFAESFGTAPILVLAPHPDDESLGCGGLIAEACAPGVPPVVVILTDGRGSHPNSRLFPAGRLIDLRASEALSATASLGLPSNRLIFLGYPDTAAPSEGAAIDRVVDLMATYHCRTLVSAWRHDPHCDHEAAAMLAAAVCRRTRARHLSYPVWGWRLPHDQIIDCPPIRGFRLDIAPHLDAKRRAILAHRSQYAGIIPDDPTGFQMPSGFIERFLAPTEIYIEEAMG